MFVSLDTELAIDNVRKERDSQIKTVAYLEGLVAETTSAYYLKQHTDSLATAKKYLEHIERELAYLTKV